METDRADEEEETKREFKNSDNDRSHLMKVCEEMGIGKQHLNDCDEDWFYFYDIDWSAEKAEIDTLGAIEKEVEDLNLESESEDSDYQYQQERLMQNGYLKDERTPSKFNLENGNPENEHFS